VRPRTNRRLRSSSCAMPFRRTALSAQRGSPLPTQQSTLPVRLRLPGKTECPSSPVESHFAHVMPSSSGCRSRVRRYVHLLCAHMGGTGAVASVLVDTRSRLHWTLGYCAWCARTLCRLPCPPRSMSRPFVLACSCSCEPMRPHALSVTQNVDTVPSPTRKPFATLSALCCTQLCLYRTTRGASPTASTISIRAILTQMRLLCLRCKVKWTQTSLARREPYSILRSC
jgi:hypothetical protein